MKKILIVIFLSCLFFLSGCRSLVSVPPITQKTPDVISKPTKTIISKETIGQLSKDTFIKTDSEDQVEVKLEKDTVATLVVPSSVNLPEITTTPQIESEGFSKKESTLPPKVSALENHVQVILPKNTSVVLPENTYLQTSDHAKVIMEAQTEVTLPVGTEISITRINWYAILFYSLLLISLGYYYFQSKTDDRDGDGFIDIKQKKDKKNLKI